jgi:hypothetical protein
VVLVKLTLAIHLAAEATRRGLRAVLVDLDPQASAGLWDDKREAAGSGGIIGPQVMGLVQPHLTLNVMVNFGRNCPGCRPIELSRLGRGACQTPMGRDQDFG